MRGSTRLEVIRTDDKAAWVKIDDVIIFLAKEEAGLLRADEEQAASTVRNFREQLEDIR